MGRFAWAVGLLAAAFWLSPRAAGAQAFADWVRPTAVVRPVGGAEVRGEVAFMPTADDGYEVRASVVPGYRRITWGAAAGTCAALAAGGVPAPRVLAEQTPPLSGNWQLATLRLAAPLADHLVLIGHAGDPAAPSACADLPVAEARRRAPPADVPPASAPVTGPDGAAVAGAARLWPTASGDLFLRVELGRPPPDPLNWHVIEGTCAAWRHPDAWTGAPPLVTDAAAPAVGSAPPRRGARVLARPGGGREMAVVVPAEWLGRTAEQQLTAQAFVNVGGRGQLVACADLPILAARGAVGLPRAGGPTPIWAVAAGAALVLAGALLRAGDTLVRIGSRATPGRGTGVGLVVDRVQ